MQPLAKCFWRHTARSRLVSAILTPGGLEMFFQRQGRPNWWDWILLCILLTCLLAALPCLYNTRDENKAIGLNPQVTPGFTIIPLKQRALGNRLLTTGYPKINIFWKYLLPGTFLVSGLKTYGFFKRSPLIYILRHAFKRFNLPWAMKLSLTKIADWLFMWLWSSTTELLF